MKLFIMNKAYVFICALTGAIKAYTSFEDLPIHFIWGIAYVGLMIEAGKLEKKPYPMLSNLILSSVIGWAVSSGVMHLKPEWFEGGLKILSTLISTIFSYLIIIYFIKYEIIEKLVARYIHKKINKDDDNRSSN